MNLFGTRALVTGGGRGIGRGISLALARAGADLCISYRARNDAATATAQEIRDLGQQAHIFQADMGNPADVQNLLDASVATLGGIDIVVCNAGMHYRRPFLDISVEEWDEVLNADLRAPFLLGQAASRQMIAQGHGGRIIMITSISAEVAYPNLVHYQAAKAGLKMLARGMALELVEHGITVNAVAPGVTLTDLSVDSLTDPVQREKRLGRIPMGRPGDPKDIGAAVAFIASDQTEWMTGTTITVDGGQTVL